jgi:hypothetical protein
MIMRTRRAFYDSATSPPQGHLMVSLSGEIPVVNDWVGCLGPWWVNDGW